MGRDYWDVQRAKQQREMREQKAAIKAFSPGYLSGFVPYMINGTLSIGPGVANVYGREIEVSEYTQISDALISADLEQQATYYLYITNSGEYIVDARPPQYSGEYFGWYHPIAAARMLHRIGRNSQGGLYAFKEEQEAVGFTSIILQPKVITQDITIPADYNGLSVGPVEIADGVTVTVDGIWVIV